jgi:hypothetical protein
LLVLVGLNIKATQFVRRDELLESGQRTAQMVLIWLVPVIGAIIVIAMHFLLSEPRRARKDVDLGDEGPLFREPLSRGQREYTSADD